MEKKKISALHALLAQIDRLGMYEKIWETANLIKSPMEHTHFWMLSTPELIVLSKALDELERFRKEEEQKWLE